MTRHELLLQLRHSVEDRLWGSRLSPSFVCCAVDAVVRFLHHPHEGFWLKFLDPGLLALPGWGDCTDSSVLAGVALVAVDHGDDDDDEDQQPALNQSPLDAPIVGSPVVIESVSELVLGLGSVSISPSGLACLFYTHDAADDLLCVDLGGLPISNKTKKIM